MSAFSLPLFQVYLTFSFLPLALTGLTMPTALNPPPHLPGSNEAVSPQRYHSPDAASVSASGALTELILSNDNSNN